MGVLVNDQRSSSWAGGRARPTSRRILPSNSPEAHAWTRVTLPELVLLVQHDRRSLLGNVREHPTDAVGRRLEVRDDLTPGLGVEAVRVLHDEPRRDLAPEAGFGAPLALDLVEQPPRGRVRRLALEHRPDVHHRLRRVVTAIVEMGEQQPDFRVVLRTRGPLERRERVVRSPGVDRGDPSPFRKAGSSGVSVGPA